MELSPAFQKILNDEQPYTFLYARKNVSAIHRRFDNVEAYPEGLKPQVWWVPRARQKYFNQPEQP